MATNRRTRKPADAPTTDATAVEPAAPEPAPDHDTGTPETPASTATADTTATVDSADATTPDAPVSAIPVSAAPTSGAPAGKPDLKVIMVAGVLGDHPDGVSAADVVDQSGLRAAIVGRALAAMEIAGAAVRMPAGPDGAELWQRGDTDPATVSLDAAPTFVECPTCGHRRKITASVGTRRVSTTPGTNSNGLKTLRKGDLRAMVLAFINEHPGHVFTAYDIARELERSPGAVINNLNHFLAEGLVAYADSDGKKVTALASTSD